MNTDELADCHREWPEREPEVPTVTELEQKAAEAWSLMMYHAMPGRIALDFVQDVTGDRGKSLEALIMAATCATANARPSAEGDVGGSFADLKAGEIGRAMLGGHFDTAEKLRCKLRDQLERMEFNGMGHPSFTAAWLEWCEDCHRAIGLCSGLVVAVAHPEGS